MNRRIAVRGVFVHEGKMLLVRLKHLGGEETEYWCTVGGGLDEGEAILDGLKREIVEETGIEPVIGRLLFVQQYREPDQECIEFFFDIENAADYLQIDLAKSTHGQKEIAELAFVDPKTVHALPELLQEVDLSSYGAQSPTEFYSYL